MPRYIDATALIDKRETVGLCDAQGNYFGTAEVVFVEDIEKASTADVEEVRHGKIVKTGRRYPYCSVCDTSLERSYFRYCPYCGATFDEDKSRIVDDAISEIKMLEDLIGDEQ